MSRPGILIIDDDVGTCETLSDIFQEKGFDVVSVNTGHEAINKARDMSFDAALVDISLPEKVKNTHIGQRVYIRFEHGTMPLAGQWYRSLRQLFLRNFYV